MRLHTEHENHLVTIYGCLKESYVSTPSQQLHDIGQGSIAAPIVWLLISSIILISMKTWSQGVMWSSPDSSVTTKRHADSYVDNTTLWVNGILKETNLR